MTTKAEIMRPVMGIALGAGLTVQFAQAYCGDELPASFQYVHNVVQLLFIVVMGVAVLIGWRDQMKKKEEAQRDV